MIKAVIFDVGGVLHSSTSKDVKRNICQTMGVTEKEYTTACNTLIPLYNGGEIVNEKEFWKRFIIFTKSKATIPNYSLWSREFSYKYQIQIEVMKIVSNLKQQGLKLAILSNTIEPHAKVNREKGIYSPFKVVILSYEVGIRKPDPKIYKITLNKLCVKAEEAVFVDDSDKNVEAAITLGIHGIVFKNTDQLKKDLTKIGVRLTN